MDLKKMNLAELNQKEMQETNAGNPWAVVAIVLICVVAYYATRDRD